MRTTILDGWKGRAIVMKTKGKTDLQREGKGGNRVQYRPVRWNTNRQHLAISTGHFISSHIEQGTEIIWLTLVGDMSFVFSSIYFCSILTRCLLGWFLFVMLVCYAGVWLGFWSDPAFYCSILLLKAGSQFCVHRSAFDFSLMRCWFEPVVLFSVRVDFGVLCWSAFSESCSELLAFCCIDWALGLFLTAYLEHLLVFAWLFLLLALALAEMIVALMLLPCFFPLTGLSLCLLLILSVGSELAFAFLFCFNLLRQHSTLLDGASFMLRSDSLLILAIFLSFDEQKRLQAGFELFFFFSFSLSLTSHDFWLYLNSTSAC